jgi:signal transduction histidine kinase
VIEWNEMYDIADGLSRTAQYDDLPPGKYLFHVAELTAMGIPTGVETVLPILVLQPLWKRPWFLVASFIGFSGACMGGAYYVMRRRVGGEILRLKNQRMLEQERLRIAKDIHDDLGARVTQISLVSAMAHGNPIDPERARADFEQISQMARDLVGALYETVWAVNPANDNLKELGNYLFQLGDKMCARTPCRFRFYVDDLPRGTVISSQIRHNLSMAVKEALHNAVKHANASEIAIRIVFRESALHISIVDDGRGFDTGGKFTGSGLVNLRQRLSDIGGVCVIESQPGSGTTIHLRLTIEMSRG